MKAKESPSDDSTSLWSPLNEKIIAPVVLPENLKKKTLKDLAVKIGGTYTARAMAQLDSPLGEFISQIETDERLGLRKGEIEDRMAAFGHNQICEPKPTNFLYEWFKCCGDRKNAEYSDIVREYLPTECEVIREGEQLKLSLKAIVKGDLIILKAGQYAPADIRLVEANDLTVDNYLFTGVHDELPRSTESNYPNSVLDYGNCVLMGAKIIKGNARGIVYETGFKSALGTMVRTTP